MGLEQALAGLDRIKLRKMGVSHSDGEMILHLLSILNKYGLYATETDPEFQKSPASKLDAADVEILKNLPRIIATIKRQRGEKGEPGGPGRPGRDAVVDVEEIVRRTLRKIPVPRDGRDAVVDVDDIVRRVVAKVPKPKDGKDGGPSPIDAQKIREIVLRNMPQLPQNLDRGATPEFTSAKLNGLTASQLVGTDAAKQLISIAVSIVELSYLAGLTGNIQDQIDALTTPTFVDREIPTGAVNDINVTFTLANTPDAGSEHIFLNGVLQQGGGEDYTLSGAIITFVVPPETGNRILASYRH